MARILVVDPEAPVRALTRRILVMDGHEVVDVGTGGEALALLTQPFDVMLVDVAVPDIDGNDLLDAIRLTPCGFVAPMIVTSAPGDAEGAIREARAGVLDRVDKPFGFGAIQSAIRRALESTPKQLDDLRVIRTVAADAYGSAHRLREAARLLT